jgi:HlyD family secretion protein
MRPVLLFSVVMAMVSPALPGLVMPALAQTEPPAAEAVTANRPAITVVAAAPRLLRDRVLASGLIAPVEMVQVAPLIEGQPIESLMADVGDRVEQGQVLARLSRSSLDLQRSQFTASLAAARATIAQVEAQLIEARSSAEEAQRVATRTAQLREQGAVSQAAADSANANAISATARVNVATQSLEAARAQVALVQAQMANVDLQLQRTEVTAPFAGEITARNAVVGAIATAGGPPLFSIIRDGALELQATVAEADLLRLASGQKATLRLVGGAEPLSGTIRLVEPTIDAVTRQGRLRIALEPEANVRSGMFVDAEILVAEREALAVPVTAVGSGAEGSTVMRVTDGLVTRVSVVTGIRDGSWIEIREGLQPGDQVVMKAGAFVRDGDRVNPVPAMN